ncbi:MAG: hypothetical protein CL932_11870, partial [Deltaproteobacteria bacterium]|nr:hypothetical protein [Deltaproteobacteria bacterium]
MNELFAQLRGLLGGELGGEGWSGQVCELLQAAHLRDEETYRELWVPYLETHAELWSFPLRECSSSELLAPKGASFQSRERPSFLTTHSHVRPQLPPFASS